MAFWDHYFREVKYQPMLRVVLLCCPSIFKVGTLWIFFYLYKIFVEMARKCWIVVWVLIIYKVRFLFVSSNKSIVYLERTLWLYTEVVLCWRTVILFKQINSVSFCSLGCESGLYMIIKKGVKGHTEQKGVYW